METLCALNDLAPDDPLIRDELKAVNDAVVEMSQGGIKDCFATNKNRNFHRTALAYVNQMFQQVGKKLWPCCSWDIC